MSADNEGGPFFIGWAVPERSSWPFLAAVCAALIALSFTVAYLVAATMNDPGSGGRVGQAQAIGVLQSDPYPVLHVLDSEQFAPGTTIFLMGQGKNGAQGRADPLDGQVVRVAGAWLNRGGLSGLNLRGGQNGLRAAEGEGELPAPEDLGRWRLTGEIADGNCLLGAMRPGRGMGHRACANLCILGGLPAIFVATDEVGGRSSFLIGGVDGGPLPEELLDYTALLIEAEGRVERRGGINVFLIDVDSVELAR